MSEPIPSCVGERCLIITLIKADILQLYQRKKVFYAAERLFPIKNLISYKI